MPEFDTNTLQTSLNNIKGLIILSFLNTKDNFNDNDNDNFNSSLIMGVYTSTDRFPAYVLYYIIIAECK